MRAFTTRFVPATRNALAMAGALLIAMLAWPLAAEEARSAAKTDKAPPELAAMIASAVGDTIVPAYQFFGDVSAKTTDAVASWCQSPSPATLEAARTAFSGSVHAWARIQHIRFGPARTDNRWQRIAFLPDPRGVVRRQIAKVLAERPQDLLTVEAIAENSAAVQGLPALELLLYALSDNEAPETLAYRCRLAQAIAGHVQLLARSMAGDWTGPDGGWRQHLLSAGVGSNEYKSPNEAASELVRSLLTGLQIVREEMLLPWLRAAEEKKTWAGLPFERSGRARDVIATSIVALRNLHKALHLDLVISGLAAKDKSKAWMKGWVVNAYGSLESDAKSMVLAGDGKDLELSSEDNLRALRRARFNINGLRQIIGREIAPAAALTIGFNELDGD